MKEEIKEHLSSLSKLRFTIKELDFMYKRYGLCAVGADGKLKELFFEDEKSHCWPSDSKTIKA